MSIYSLDNGFVFIFYSEDKMKKNSDELSRAIIKKFGNVPDQSSIKDMLHYSFEWCADKLTAILNDQTELRFYQAIFLLHEFSCHFTSNHPKTSPVPKISIEEYALYRKTLKLCLEHACDLNLSDDKAFSFSYFDEIDTIIETILYWGGEAYFFSNLLAEEKMYKGSVHFRSEVPGKVSFQRNPYFEFFQMEMSRDTAISSVLVSDKSWFSDFATATKNCLGIEFDHIQKTICMIHDYNEQRGGQLVLCNWAVFPKVLQEVFGVDYDKGAAFFRGFTLNRENKLSLKEAIYKSNSLNRSLYRPMLVWLVDNTPMTILGESAFDHAIISLCRNSFGWGKYPEEWKNKCFDAFINSKKKTYSDILEDAIEHILRENKILYDRNIKYLRKWNNKNLDINKSPGEIDFLFIHDHTIYIADSKHHLERFDLNNFRIDYSNFDRIYNNKLEKKIRFTSLHTDVIEEHFQVILNNPEFKLNSKEIEGIFIINLPTYIMNLNKYRVVTLFGLLQIIGKGPKYKSYMLFPTPENGLDLNVFYYD